MTSDSDDINSDVEFELYSQLHYNTTNNMLHDKMERKGEKHGDAMTKDFNNMHKITFNKAPIKTFDAKYNTLHTLEMEHERKIMSFPLDNSDFDSQFINQNVESDIEDWEVICDDVNDDKHDNLLINVENKNISVNDQDNILWKVCQKDIDASKLLGHRKTELRYFGGNEHSNLRCKNCDERGHISVNCILPKKVRPCYKCGEVGHYAIKCPKRFSGIYKYWDTQCHRCGQFGHIQGECPDQWRQFHMTTKPGAIIASDSSSKAKNKISCYNCAKIGHFGHDCERSSANGSGFVSPLVCVYDKWKNLIRRKLKKDLRRNKVMSDYANHKKEKNRRKSKKAKALSSNNNFHSSVSSTTKKIGLKKAVLKTKKDAQHSKKKSLLLKAARLK